MPKRRAADARVSINGTFLSVQRYRPSSTTSSIQVTNTEGTTGNTGQANARGFAANIPDIFQGEVEIVMATFDDDENPFANPIDLDDGSYYNVQLFPAGSGVAWSMPNALCTYVSGDGSIPGPQPVTARFLTDGTYGLPE